MIQRLRRLTASLAVNGETQQRHMATITNTHLGQGEQERLHPGKLTFGSAAVFKQTGQGVVPVSEDAPNALPAPESPMRRTPGRSRRLMKGIDDGNRCTV